VLATIRECLERREHEKSGSRVLAWGAILTPAAAARTVKPWGQRKGPADWATGPGARGVYALAPSGEWLVGQRAGSVWDAGLTCASPGGRMERHDMTNAIRIAVAASVCGALTGAAAGYAATYLHTGPAGPSGPQGAVGAVGAVGPSGPAGPPADVPEYVVVGRLPAQIVFVSTLSGDELCVRPLNGPGQACYVLTPGP
jgi:hypothetical protein